MNRKLSFVHAVVLGCLAVTACGEDENPGPGGIDCDAFGPPQILPVQQPICFSDDPVVLGDPLLPEDATRGALLQNFGNTDLVVSTATLTGDPRGHFRIQGVEEGVPITCPEAAAVGLIYEPTEPGWDSATLVVTSNAQNFPTLRIFLLALAVPSGDPNYDPGDKPPEALAGGEEACPNM